MQRKKYMNCPTEEDLGVGTVIGLICGAGTVILLGSKGTFGIIAAGAVWFVCTVGGMLVSMKLKPYFEENPLLNKKDCCHFFNFGNKEESQSQPTTNVAFKQV